jgi:type IV pilus assembly protein PilO
VYALVALAAALPAWWLLSAGADADLRAAREREPSLRTALTAKMAQAAEITPLQRRRQELQDIVSAQERQLPPPGQVDVLLTALHGAAQQHGLQVELMRPEPAQPRDDFTVQPIALRLSGRYHALGAFAADVAALEPPVSLHDLQLTAGTRDAGVVLQATARSHRRPDPAPPGKRASGTAPAPAASGARP